GLSLGWHATSAARGAAWWNSWANGWTPQIAQPGFTFVGGLALALLFGRSMVGPLFAQTAWTNVTFVGSEVRDPGKNLVRALVVGCGIVVVLYLLANVAYLAVLPFPEIQHAPQNRVAVAMMNAVFGHPGAMCMAAAIMISTFGCNNGLILSGARVYYAMARDRLFFQKVATTNRFYVPAAALVAQAIWTAFLALPRTVTINAATHEVTYGNVYNQLLEYIVSADLLFYVSHFMCRSVDCHRARQRKKRSPDCLCDQSCCGNTKTVCGRDSLEKQSIACHCVVNAGAGENQPVITTERRNHDRRSHAHSARMTEDGVHPQHGYAILRRMLYFRKRQHGQVSDIGQ